MKWISIISILLIVTSCEQDKHYLAVSKIKGAAKLATTETVVNKVILATKERKFIGVIRLGKAHFAARTKAFVKAGVDLTELKKEDVKISENGKVIEINLPPVKVLDFSFPFDHYEIDFEVTRDGFLTKMSAEDHERLYRMAELDIRRKLEITGLKESTEQRTRTLVESILKGVGFQEIYIEFRDGEFIEAPRLDDTDVI